jgi:hypothetical protein
MHAHAYSMLYGYHLLFLAHAMLHLSVLNHFYPKNGCYGT